MKRCRIVTEQADYIHAEFTSALFRFVDDVEFLADDLEKLIHVRGLPGRVFRLRGQPATA